MGREKFEFATNKRVRFFNTAIDAIFKNWHALQMAVAHVSRIIVLLSTFPPKNSLLLWIFHLLGLIKIISASWRSEE